MDVAVPWGAAEQCWAEHSGWWQVALFAFTGMPEVSREAGSLSTEASALSPAKASSETSPTHCFGTTGWIQECLPPHQENGKRHLQVLTGPELCSKAPGLRSSEVTFTFFFLHTAEPQVTGRLSWHSIINSEDASWTVRCRGKIAPGEVISMSAGNAVPFRNALGQICYSSSPLHSKKRGNISPSRDASPHHSSRQWGAELCNGAAAAAVCDWQEPTWIIGCHVSIFLSVKLHVQLIKIIT